MGAEPLQNRSMYVATFLSLLSTGDHIGITILIVNFFVGTGDINDINASPDSPDQV